MYETRRQANVCGRYVRVDQIHAGSNAGLVKKVIGIRIDCSLGSK